MLSGFATILGLGFLLGIRHAIEPDHVVAVSTVASKTKSFTQAASAGISWGIGHTFTLFIIGMILLPIGQTIPEHIALSLELIVALVIIGLGISTLLFFKKKKSSVAEGKIRSNQSSFMIGTIHGLAGSGAMILLTMAQVEQLSEAAVFILIFGMGTILGMLAFAVLFSLPFIYLSHRTKGMERYLGIGAGIFSIAFGLFFIYEIGFVEGLFSLV